MEYFAGKLFVSNILGGFEPAKIAQVIDSRYFNSMVSVFFLIWIDPTVSSHTVAARAWRYCRESHTASYWPTWHVRARRRLTRRWFRARSLHRQQQSQEYP